MKLSTTLIAASVGMGLALVANLDSAQAKGPGMKAGIHINVGRGPTQLSIGNDKFRVKINNSPVHVNQIYQEKHRCHIDWYYGCYSYEFAPVYTYYCNPYVLVPVEGVPVLEATAIDPRAQAETEQGLQFLAAARQAFLARNLNAALANVNHALIEMPNNPNAHQLKSLTLFAMGKFRESASSAHVGLTSGRGWNWTTLISFYPLANDYTAQLRRLELAVEANPGVAAPRFLLAYHYMMMGHGPQALAHLQGVVHLEPRDQLAGQMLKVVGSKLGAPIAGNVGQPGPLATQAAPIEPSVEASQINEQPIDPASINNQAAPAPTAPVESAPAPGPIGPSAQVEGNVELPQEAQAQPAGPTAIAQIGTFKASPAEGVEIRVELRPDGTFTWKVDAKGQKKEFSGKFTMENNTLTLARENDGQKMVGTLTPIDQNSFNFKLQNAKEKDTGLNFARI